MTAPTAAFQNISGGFQDAAGPVADHANMVQTRKSIVFKTPFARVATALWSVALALVVLLLFLLPGKAPTAAETAPAAKASVAPAAKLANSSPMLEASVHATAKDKLD